MNSVLLENCTDARLKLLHIEIVQFWKVFDNFCWLEIWKLLQTLPIDDRSSEISLSAQQHEKKGKLSEKERERAWPGRYHEQEQEHHQQLHDCHDLRLGLPESTLDFKQPDACRDILWKNTTWYYVRTVQHWCHSAVLYSDNMLL